MEKDVIMFENLSVKHILSERQAEPTNGNFCHDRFEIVYYLTSGGSITVEGKRYDPIAGSILLTTPFAYHKVETDDHVNSEVWSIQFTRGVLPENVSKMLDVILGDEDNSGKFFPAECLVGAEEIFKRFAVASTLPDEQRRIFAEALISELIILLSVAKGDSISHSGDCLGARVMRYLNKNIERNISLDKLARHFFVSKYHLCRAFKEHCGISVHSYINHKRIMYARELIEGGETASGAAEKVGFGDYSAFYRAYVKIVGKSPTAN